MDPSGWQIAANAAIAAVVGGTASKAAGGSFEAGGLQAMFGRLFNELYMMTEVKLPNGKTVQAYKGSNLLQLKGELSQVQSCTMYQVTCVVLGVTLGEGPANQAAEVTETNISRAELAAEGVSVVNGKLKGTVDAFLEVTPFYKRAVNILKNTYNAAHFTNYCSAQCNDGIENQRYSNQ